MCIAALDDGDIALLKTYVSIYELDFTVLTISLVLARERLMYTSDIGNIYPPRKSMQGWTLASCSSVSSDNLLHSYMDSPCLGWDEENMSSPL